MPKTVKQGNAIKRTGTIFLITGLLFGIVLNTVPYSDFDEVLFLISFLPLIMVLSGAFLFWRGRQYVAQSIVQEVLFDVEPDVLYLRAFKTDPSTARFVFSSIFTPTLMSGLVTEEEQLKEVLLPFGDLVAIGKPSEGLPTPGASRLYATDEEWKEVVTDQLQAALLVVIRAGTGEGLLWEIHQAIDVVSPEKLLILILNMKKKDYETFRHEIENVVNAKFPSVDMVKRFGRVSGFFRFTKNWQPEYLPMQLPYFRRSVYKPLRRAFQYTLRPIFEQFGLPWQPPGVSILTVSALTILAGVVFLILFATMFSF